MRATRSVLDALLPAVCIYDCSLGEVLAWYKAEGDAWPIKHQTQLVMTDQPYSLLHVPHDKISLQDMVLASRVIGRFLRPGGHVVSFRLADQIAACKALLRTLRVPRLMKLLVMVHGAPLVVMRRPQYQTVDASRSTTALKNLAERAVQESANGAGHAGFASVHERKNGFVQSRYKGTHNVLENVRKASPAEISYATMGHQRQQVIGRLSQPQDTVLELFGGTSSTAASCAAMPGGQLSRFVGFERDQVCAQLSTASLARSLAPLVRDGHFDAALKLSAKDACAFIRHATSLIPVAAGRSGSARRSGAMMSETRPPPHLCQWKSLPNPRRFF